MKRVIKQKPYRVEFREITCGIKRFVINVTAKTKRSAVSDAVWNLTFDCPDNLQGMRLHSAEVCYAD